MKTLTKQDGNKRNVLIKLKEESRIVPYIESKEPFIIVSILDAIQADRSLRYSGGDFEKGYTGLKTQVDSMIRLEKEMELYVKSNQTPSQKLFYNSRKFILTLIGKRPYTIEELLDLQLKNIKGMNSNLTGIIFESRNELSSLETYLNTTISRLESHVKGREEKQDILTKKTKIYSEAFEVFKDMKKTDDNYFGYEKDLMDIRRQVQEESHIYKMNNDSIIDLGQEKEFLKVIEDLLRVSIYTCERISNKTNHLENHITNTKRIYFQLQRQQATIVSLAAAVDALTRSTMDVHQILGAGLQNMVQIANSPDLLNSFYSTSSNNLGDILNDIETANKIGDSEIDSFVNVYLNH